MKIIVGLGNPGVRYLETRHNIGFRVVDRLAETCHIPLSTKRHQTLYGTGSIDSQKVILVKPMTYMNRSGEAVGKMVHFFHLGIENLIVIHDDLDLPFGRFRFKQRGGDGGHQGVRSIIELLGGANFLRLKVGIGRPPRGMEPAEYVLNSFDLFEQSHLDRVIDQAVEALRVLISDGIQTAMNRFQKKNRTEEG
ncbi:MAG: aminoacyl-tRNA hydrolase [Deltaproteobacteria bacterium RBG_16_49_23]|nr:MAG: aminoacyl-tRNA hydrolase [Deltaproteobacteria bacterium RBG_16_49_23]